MTSIKWTKSQRQAIDGRGDVIVAASAGTGKTAVLSHRCIELLSDAQKPADIDRILVLTFTEDAAAEMKERIAKTIRQKAAQTHERRLYRQLLRLDIADISTIHSFCRKLIADNFFRLGIDPDFAIIEGDEQKLLREEILDDVIEKAWENSELSEAMKVMLEGRSADLKTGVLKNIYAIDEFMNSLVSIEDWVNMSRGGCADLIKDQYAALLKGNIEVCRYLCEQAVELDLRLTGGHYAGNLNDFRTGLDAIEALINGKRIYELGRMIENVRSIRFRNKPKGGDDDTYLRARKPVSEIAKPLLKKMKDELADSDIADVLIAGEAADRAALLDITMMFRSEYERRKKELKCLDFSDLERLALKLLTNPDGSASDTAKELREYYQYIFVDEYQDINKLQDRIVQLVSVGRNLFIVGDVKQSIYSWRQARPELFLARIRDGAKEGAMNVYLNDNFRCRSEIIDFVNAVFSQIMKVSTAGMDYDDNAALVFGAKGYLPFSQVCADPSACANELHIITSEQNNIDAGHSGPDEQQDWPGQDELEQSSRHRRQAVVIARRIRQLVGDKSRPAELKIADRDKGGLRDAEYGDIVILMRSLKGRVNDYVDVLRQHNIPVDASVTASYFESPEVNDCLSILKVIDNPLRDIELAAAMRSPVFGFTDSELLAVRQKGGKSPFYNCVMQCACGQDGLARRLADMLAVIESWRRLASRSRLADAVWRILRQNDFLSFASALPGGMQKRADLLKLYERAMQFERFVSAQGSASLGRFIDFIERLRSSDGDWSQAEADLGQSSSVRIMSIHKSKGLEFPVVFLAGMEKKFNTADTKELCLLDEDLPLGLKVYLEERGRNIATACYNVIKSKKQASAVAEEMRTLYVAMTRAREKLVMVADTCGAGNAESGGYAAALLDELATYGSSRAFKWWLGDCNSRSYLDWIIAALRGQSDVGEVLRKGGAIGGLNIFITDALSLMTQCAAAAVAPASAADEPVEPRLLAGLKSRLSRRYEYEGVLSLPVKNSVSKITHRDDEFNVDFFAASIDDADLRLPHSHDGTDSRTLGTATHLVFENLPLHTKPDAAAVAAVIGRLEQCGAISQQAAAHINADEILAFFDTPVGKRIFDKDVKVYREYPFTIGLSPADCGFDAAGQEKGDDIIVQGIIDMLIIAPEGMIVVDFKTDNITHAQIQQRARLYSKQLRLYGFAASRILKRSVAAKWLYFLKPSVAVECEEGL